MTLVDRLESESSYLEPALCYCYGTDHGLGRAIEITTKSRELLLCQGLHCLVMVFGRIAPFHTMRLRSRAETPDARSFSALVICSSSSMCGNTRSFSLFSWPPRSPSPPQALRMSCMTGVHGGRSGAR